MTKRHRASDWQRWSHRKRIWVDGLSSKERAREPHEYRSQLGGKDKRSSCDLDGLSREAPIHRF